VTADTKPQAEAKLWELVQHESAELVVLARYMQVLSNDMCRKLSGKAINIHTASYPASKAPSLITRRTSGV
jgi:formyltetrahydrofolate deformylase